VSVTCDFPNPPGGKLTCDVGQTGFVEIRDDGIFAICRTPPAGVRAGQRHRHSPAYKKWVLAMAYGREFWPFQTQLTSQEEAEFDAGVIEYSDKWGRRVRVEFSVPVVGEEPHGGGEVAGM
jgi:hypothetical protein